MICCNTWTGAAPRHGRAADKNASDLGLADWNPDGPMKHRQVQCTSNGDDAGRADRLLRYLIRARRSRSVRPACTRSQLDDVVGQPLVVNVGAEPLAAPPQVTDATLRRAGLGVAPRPVGIPSRRDLRAIVSV